jgi:ribulose-phosphate 3-epimerase
LDKLRRVRQLVSDEVFLEVDGGVNASTIRRCAEAGAQLFVAGSAVFRSGHYGEAMQHLYRLATAS